MKREVCGWRIQSEVVNPWGEHVLINADRVPVQPGKRPAIHRVDHPGGHRAPRPRPGQRPVGMNRDAGLIPVSW